MSCEIFYDIVQGTEAWRNLRCGLVTMSEASTIMAKGKDGGASVTRRKYMLRLAGERILGEPEETYRNDAMDRGNSMEAEARAKYAFTHGVEPQLVGFIRNGDKGCSPDALLGDNAMLEIKTAIPSILIDKILRADFPPEHRAQTQGNLWVAEREKIDLVIHWPRLPQFVVTAYRDSAYIRQLAEAVAAFNEELDEVVAKVRAYTGDSREDAKSMFERSLASG